MSWQKQKREQRTLKAAAGTTPTTAPLSPAPTPTPALAPVPRPTPTPVPTFSPVPPRVKAPVRALSEYARNYFGTRNNITFEQAGLREGINYTNATLAITPLASMADRITHLIGERMPLTSDGVTTGTFNVFDANAGIGGYTLSFLDNPIIEKVFSSELDPVKRQMLTANVSAYKFEPRSVIDPNFTGVPIQYAGSAVFMDMSVSAKIGGFTLGEWMAKSPHVALIVARVPGGTTVPPLIGWTVEVNDTLRDMGRLLIATSAVGMETARKKATLQTNVDEYTQWKAGLEEFIRGMLEKILPAEDIPPYLSEESMKIWTQAFTHETRDANFNYEELELVGDRVLELTFTKYLLMRIEGIKKNGVSALKDRYMSKSFQHTIAKNLGFGPWIRVRDMTTNISVLEDVFESFFGALFDVSNTLTAYAYGYLNCFNLLTVIFNDIPLNLAYIHGRSKTQLKEWFEGLGWVPPGQGPPEEVITSDVGVKATIYLSEEGFRYLTNRGFKVNRALGSAIGNTKKVATHEAYDNAFEYLNSIGVTRDWVVAEKDEREFSNPRLAPYVPAARARLAREGFVGMRFSTPRTGTTKTSCVVQLLGIREDGSLETLASLNACNASEGKALVLEEYARGGRTQ